MSERDFANAHLALIKLSGGLDSVQFRSNPQRGDRPGLCGALAKQGTLDVNLGKIHVTVPAQDNNSAGSDGPPSSLALPVSETAGFATRSESRAARHRSLSPTGTPTTDNH